MNDEFSIDEEIKQAELKRTQLQENLTKLTKLIEEARVRLIFVEGQLEAFGKIRESYKIDEEIKNDGKKVKNK